VAVLDGRPAPFGIAAQVWELLACPCPAHGELAADAVGQRVVCTACGRRYEVLDGIPLLLIDEASAGPAAPATEPVAG
jgi:uncharacterized protein YbaR (Trm112 family)